MTEIENIIASEEYKTIEKDVEAFVKEKLNGYLPENRGKKTIHDPVWGSVDYSGWEMQLIDSPLFQRLRDINQVGLAVLTYPAARHSRFEHSLGVASAAKMMCDKIDKNSKDYTIPDAFRNRIVLAALLHDIGHCFYSHLSETIYGDLKEFAELRKVFNSFLELKPKPHEILSFVIINTESFKVFFEDYVKYPEDSIKTNKLMQEIGCMIIGQNIEDGKNIYSFMTSVINGPFDADKLDYIRRDSLTAGLALQYDIERLFTKIQIHSIPCSDKIEYKLVINFNGITAIEELTFCKIMLFSYIYYHQKVLVSETMIKDYAYGLYELGIINTFADFLRYTDSDVLKLSVKQKEQQPFPVYGDINLQRLADNIKNRKLPRRCFEVSQNSVIPLMRDEGDEEDKELNYATSIIKKIQSLGDGYDALILRDDMREFSTSVLRKKESVLDGLIIDYRDLTYTEMLDKRKEFYIELVKKYKEEKKKIDFTLFDIYIVFPKLVNYGSNTDAVVLGKDQQELMSIDDFVKLDDWAGSFNSNKWRGYIFVSDRIDIGIAFRVAEKLVLKGKARLRNPRAYLKGLEN